MRKALIVDGEVKQLDLTNAALSAAQIEAGWRIVEDSVAPGMVEQTDNSFASPEVASTVEDVKAEANRRILQIVPEWKQRNLIAQATRLNRKDQSEWTPEEQAQVDAGDAIWAQVEAIRARSDEIEAMNPIPSNVTDNALWD